MTKRQAHDAYARANEAWGNEFIRVYGPRIPAREFERLRRGEPGTKLRRLHDARETARIEWEHACGIAA